MIILNRNKKQSGQSVLIGITLLQFDPTGNNLMTAAMGMLRKPIITHTNHCNKDSGYVFAKSPKNWTMIIWKMAVDDITATNT